MKELFDWKKTDPSWSLDEFVDEVNVHLPQYLPAEASDARVTDRMSPRLIRHYATQGMLDEPKKSGRMARYTYRHLLQAIIVRRLLAEGYAGGVIGQLTKAKTIHELEALLQGGVRLTVSVANPALAYLQEIQETAGRPRSPGELKPLVQPPPAPLEESRWRRIEVLPGCEIHISERFTPPTSAHEQTRLVGAIYRLLRDLRS